MPDSDMIISLLVQLAVSDKHGTDCSITIKIKEET